MSKLDPRGKAGRNRGRSFSRDAPHGGSGRSWSIIHGEERIWWQTGWDGNGGWPGCLGWRCRRGWGGASFANWGTKFGRANWIADRESRGLFDNEGRCGETSLLEGVTAHAVAV